MSDNVVSVDFGKEANESARRLARLLNIVEERDKALLADPKAFLDRAHAEIVRLQSILQSAEEALHPSIKCTIADDAAPPYEALETIVIHKDRYERWSRAIEIVRNWRAL